MNLILQASSNINRCYVTVDKVTKKHQVLVTEVLRERLVKHHWGVFSQENGKCS